MKFERVNGVKEKNTVICCVYLKTNIIVYSRIFFVCGPSRAVHIRVSTFLVKRRRDNCCFFGGGCVKLFREMVKIL